MEAKENTRYLIPASAWYGVTVFFEIRHTHSHSSIVLKVVLFKLIIDRFKAARSAGLAATDGNKLGVIPTLENNGVP